MTDTVRAKLPGYMAMLIVAMVVAIYARGLNGPYIFDDKTAIEFSPNLRTLWPLSQALSGPDESAAAGRPVLCLTLAINHALHGLDVRGFHLVNMALHAATALLLLATGRRALRRAGAGEHADMIAAAAALVWAVHPLHTETVQYVVQRSELLMAFFMLLTLYAFERGVDGSRRWHLLAIAACLLGMGSKESMAVVPLLVLLYDRTLVAGTLREAWSRRRWLYVGLALTWLPLAWLVMQGPRDQSVGSREGITVLSYLLTQAGVLVHYLKLAAWPLQLTIVYDWPIAERVRDWLVPGLVIASLLTLTAVGVWRNCWWGLVGAWCFLVLAPTSSVLPMTYEVAAERRMYVPLMALVLAGAAGVAWLMDRRPRWTIAAGVVVAVAWTGLSWHRVGDYRSELAIWSDAAAKQPGSHLAQHNLGLAYQKTGQLQQAVARYELALARKPTYRPSWVNLANCQLLMLRFDDAQATYRRLLAIDPDYPPAHNNLGLLLAQSGRKPEAMTHFARAVAVEPRYVDARVNLAALLVEAGRVDEARAHLDAALQLSPDHPVARQVEASFADAQ